MSLINRFVDYLRSSKNELTKVTWPTRRETIRYSAMVIAISVSIAVFFGVLDVGLSNIVTASLANKQITQTKPEAAPVVPQTQTTSPTAHPNQTQSIDFNQVTPITTPSDAPNSNPQTKN